MVLETHVKLCMAKPDFLVAKFRLKNPKIGQKQDFKNVLKKVVINFV